MTQAPPCPYCGASSYRLREKRWLTCQECGHEFDVRYDVCPACGHLNRIDAITCGRCQRRLRKDSVDQIIEARGKDRKHWTEERVTVAVAQKKTEEEISRQRMEAFWAEDQARREALARAVAEQRQRERRLLRIVILAGIVLVLALAIAAVIMTRLLRPPPQPEGEVTVPPIALVHRRPHFDLAGGSLHRALVQAGPLSGHYIPSPAWLSASTGDQCAPLTARCCLQAQGGPFQVPSPYRSLALAARSPQATERARA
jgi:hypothetical protein